MHVNTRPRIVSFALKTLTSAVASAVFLASAAGAAGLGKLTVLSSLGQPLRAEIELTAVSNDEAAGLVAKLAPPEAFRVANIEFNPALLSLQFAVEQRNGRQFIKITSTQPVNEPFVDMLLELSWSSGRLVREYTFLLDPAELRATQPAQVAAAARPAAQAARSAAPAGAASQPTQPTQSTQPAQPARTVAERPRAAPAPTTPAPAPTAATAAAARYKVRSGDTLGGIAARLKPVDISLDMMLVALYRANPEAFLGNNMNRLKSGQILNVPDSDALRGSGDGEARGVVVAHAADFNAYRNKLAGQVAAAAPAQAQEAAQSGAGKITAKVEERATAANESKDQLRLSKAAGPAGAAGSLAFGQEDKIAKDKALAEATARVRELEKNVSDLEQLMQIKNKAAAAAALTAAAPAVAGTKPVAAAPATAVLTPAPAAKKTAPAAAAKPAPEPSFVDMLMDNINYVGAALAVLLLALFGISAARRRKVVAAEPPADTSILGAPTGPAHSLFAEAGGQSVDTNNSVFNSSFAPSASQLDTNEVDPVAEADVYIAYGRDAQAEEILKEALRIHPERYPVRLKLLEIYAARKDQRAFETQAGEMYGLTKGQGDDWAQAAALGLSIDPLNPLYAGAVTAAAVAAAPSAAELGQQALLSQQLDDAFGSDQPDDAPAGLAAPSIVSDFAAQAQLEAQVESEAETVIGAPAPKDADDNMLDFDLGGLDFEPIAQVAPAGAAQAAPMAGDVPDLEFMPAAAEPAPAPPGAAALEEQPFDIEFDMAFDTPAAAAPAPAALIAQDGQEPDAEELDTAELNADALNADALTPELPDHDMKGHDLSADFDMAELSSQFDLPPLPAAPVPEPAASVPNHPLMDLDAMNFDLPFTPAATAGAPAADLTPAPAPTAAPAPAFDDPFALPGIPEAPQFDMSGIDLDLPPAAAGDLSAMQMEMETKLDLAIAYQEIGDKEGARELLEEVIKGGSDEQAGRANDMRAKLA